MTSLIRLTQASVHAPARHGRTATDVRTRRPLRHRQRCRGTVFLAASVARLRPEEIACLAVLTAGLAAVGFGGRCTASLGLIAWAWYTGFVENTYGQLTFATDDVRRLAAFVLTSAVVGGPEPSPVARHQGELAWMTCCTSP